MLGAAPVPLLQGGGEEDGAGAERGVPCCLFFRVTRVNESLSYGWAHALRPLLRFVSTARCGLASCRRSSDGPRVGSQFRSHVVVNIDALES